MSITSQNRAQRTANGYQNRMNRIRDEINRNAREMRFENNNRRDEMDDIIESIEREIDRVVSIISGQQFESTDA